MRFDANQDGQVTREEVMALRTAHFAAADRNQDGYLTADELSGLPHQGPGMGHGRMLARLVAGTLVTAPLGVKLAHVLDPVKLRTGFGWLLLVIGGKLAWG